MCQRSNSLRVLITCMHVGVQVSIGTKLQQTASVQQISMLWVAAERAAEGAALWTSSIILQTERQNLSANPRILVLLTDFKNFGLGRVTPWSHASTMDKTLLIS